VDAASGIRDGGRCADASRCYNEAVMTHRSFGTGRRVAREVASWSESAGTALGAPPHGSDRARTRPWQIKGSNTLLESSPLARANFRTACRRLAAARIACIPAPLSRPEGGATLRVRDHQSPGDVIPELPDDLTEEARLAEHARILGRMYPVLAHDLLGYLNTMALNLELLQRTSSRETIDAESAERIRRFSALVAGEIPPLDRMLKAVVGFMRRSEPPTTRFDLRALCEDLAIVFGAYARQRRLQFRSTLVDVPMVVAGDRDAVQHALTALILRLVDALPERAEVAWTVQTHRVAATLTVAAESTAGSDGAAHLGPLAASHPITASHQILERHGARIAWSHAAGGAATLEITMPLAPLSV